jgi:hypothetical protein
MENGGTEGAPRGDGPSLKIAHPSRVIARTQSARVTESSELDRPPRHRIRILAVEMPGRKKVAPQLAGIIPAADVQPRTDNTSSTTAGKPVLAAARARRPPTNTKKKAAGPFTSTLSKARHCRAQSQQPNHNCPESEARCRPPRALGAARHRGRAARGLVVARRRRHRRPSAGH